MKEKYIKLQEFVKENRFTISVIFPLVGAFLFLASFEQLLPGYLSYNAFMIFMGTMVMRLPLIAGLKPLADRKLLVGIGVLTLYSYLVEFIGVETGFPYGSFSYGIDLGPMLFGKIPLGLPVFFIPLVLNSYILALLLFPEKTRKMFYRVPLVIGLVLLIDLILDPAAVAINFWNYGGGVYYGVLVSNYLGWIVSASVAVTVLNFSFDHEKLRTRIDECSFILDDMVSFVFLWGITNLYFQNSIPVILSGILVYGLIKTERFNLAGEEKFNRYLEKI
jgi:putative membrane protein